MTKQPSTLNPVFATIRKMLTLQILAVPLVVPSLPLDAAGLPSPCDTTPSGLRRIYSAQSDAEAELLKQVLVEAGIHVEFVPSWTTGAFGVTGNRDIYVQETDYDQTMQFLKEYFLGGEQALEAEMDSPESDFSDPA